MRTIDRTSPIPIYHQLRRLIERRIKRGFWQAGDRIPTERELCETYGISRSPVRQALSELVQEGIVVRKPGLGTFVTNHISPESPAEIAVRMMCSDPDWTAVLDHVSDAWNEEHPGRAITFEVKVVPHAMFHDLLRAAVGSGTAPDVAMVDSVWVAGLADAGFLYALDDVERADPSDFGEDLHSVFVRANSLDGHLYGLPVKADASVLWYRRDWIELEGLTVPRDWDALLYVAAHFLQPKVRERYGLRYPLAFAGGTAGGEATVYGLLPFIWSAGGEVIDPEAGCIVLDSPETSRALQFLRDLVHRHGVSSPDVVSYGSDRSAKLFAQGRAAMALGGSYEAKLIQRISQWRGADFSRRVGAAAPPAPPGRDRVSAVGGTSYVVLRQCTCPALALDLLKLATEPHVIGDFYRSMWLNGPSPAFGKALGPDREPLLLQVSTMIAAGRPRPSIPEYVQVSRQLVALFEEVMLGEEPIADILRGTAKSISVIADLPWQAT